MPWGTSCWLQFLILGIYRPFLLLAIDALLPSNANKGILLPNTRMVKFFNRWQKRETEDLLWRDIRLYLLDHKQEAFSLFYPLPFLPIQPVEKDTVSFS